MRPLWVAGMFSVLTAFLCSLALRAPDATISVLAVAAIMVVVAWLAGLSSTPESSGLALSNPASAITLTLSGRWPARSLLPLITAHVVGGVVGGFAVRGLDSRLGETLVWAEPHQTAAALIVLVLMIITSWLVLAVDGGAHEGFLAFMPISSASVLSVALAAASNPAVVIGLATAGLLSWTLALTVGLAGLAGTVIGAYTASFLSPPSEQA